MLLAQPSQSIKSGNNHQPLIALRDVEKVFKNEAGTFRALKSIDLEIGSGEFVGIIGRSGSGKSTLLILAGIGVLANAMLVNRK